MANIKKEYHYNGKVMFSSTCFCGFLPLPLINNAISSCSFLKTKSFHHNLVSQRLFQRLQADPRKSASNVSSKQQRVVFL